MASGTQMNPIDLVEIPITYASGVSTQTSTSVQFFKSGRVCNINASIMVTKDASSGWYALGTFPSQYAPKTGIYFMSEKFGSIQGEMQINNSGYIVIDKSSALTSEIIRFSATWII